MVKKKGLKKFNISNKLAYTLMIILSIALLGIGVYAFSSDPTAGNPSVMGHSLGEILWPTTCTSAQVLGVNAAGDAVCVTPVDSRFTITTSGLCYNAPATCSTETLSCSVTDSTIITSADMPSSRTCFDLTISERSTLCIAACQMDLGMYPCDGRSTNQASCVGTTVTWGSSTTGICEVVDEIECHCRASGTYTDATYIAPGQRCI